MRSCLLVLILIGLFAGPGRAQELDPEALSRSVDELRAAVGVWSVTTRFLAADGSVAREVEGEYAFEWVEKDRVLSGTGFMPGLGRNGILFYIDRAEAEIEMVSVGPDGKLWVMNGPLGGDTRMSREFTTADGKTAQLRFTRFNAAADRFESRMEITTDGGATWVPGNHQVFTRKD